MNKQIIRVEPLSSYAEARKVPISMVVRTFGVWSGEARPVEAAPRAVAQGGGDGR